MLRRTAAPGYTKKKSYMDRFMRQEQARHLRDAMERFRVQEATQHNALTNAPVTSVRKNRSAKRGS